MRLISKNKQRKIWMLSKPHLKNALARITIKCFMSILILLLFLSAGNLSVCAQEYINPKTEIYSYRFRFSKLRPGTFGNTTIDTLFIGKTIMSFSWVQTGELKRYEDQAEPIAFSKMTQIDSLVFDVLGNQVTFWTDSTVQYLKRIDLTPGEWQTQIAASRWDSTKNVPVWSKFSNAVPFYAAKRYQPFDVPVFFKIKFE